MRITRLLPLLLVLPLTAQQPFTVGLSYDSAKPKSQYAYDNQLDADSNSNFGLHFSYAPWIFKGADLGFTAAVRFKKTSDLNGSYLVFDPYPVSHQVPQYFKMDYTYSYEAIGLRCLWHKPFDFGFGLQGRFEKVTMRTRDEDRESWTGDVVRPWLEAQIGYTFETPSVKPFVALVAALPLTSTDKPTTYANDDAGIRANQERLAKSMAPKFDLALHVGLRF